MNNEIDLISEAAIGKYEMSLNKPFVYFVKAMLAGFFIVVGVIFAYTTGSLVYNISPFAAPFFSATTFSLALILIYFIGGDLFTGNNMVMCIALYDKKCNFKQVLRVWIISYFGNLAGAFLLMTLFYFSGAYTESFLHYVNYAVPIKLELPVTQLIFRGIFCNFAVCLAVLGCFKLKSETAKFILIILCIFSFYISGFEHCVANMGIFSMFFYLSEGFDIGKVLYNMFFVTIGNIIGGGVLLGLPIYIVGKKH